MSILNKFYNKELSLKEVSSELFKDIENVSVACVKINNREDFIIEDIRYVSVKEGKEHSYILPIEEFLYDDGKFYIILINHPKGNLCISKHDYNIYNAGKNITKNCDVVIVCKDKGVHISVNQLIRTLN